MVTKEILFPSISRRCFKKPYYGESKFKGRLATTALLGLACVRSARASAANHPESISARPREDLGEKHHTPGHQPEVIPGRMTRTPDERTFANT
jgi:hypothetical protein